MAGEGTGISSGIGTGEAQVVPNFQYKVGAQQLGSLYAAKAKQDAEAAKLAAAKAKQQEDRLAKFYSSIKPSSSIRYADVLNKGRQQLYNLAHEAAADSSKMPLLYQQMDNYKVLQGQIADLDKFAATKYNMAAAGNPLLNKDILTEYGNRVPADLYDNPDALLGQLAKDKDALSAVKVNKFTPENFISKAGAVLNQIADNNSFQGKEVIAEDDVRTLAKTLLADPDSTNFEHYYDMWKTASKTDKALAAMTPEDGAVELAYRDLKPLEGTKTPRPSKGISISIGNGDQSKPTPTGLYEGDTQFGKGDHVFTSKTTSASFPTKQAITSVPTDSFSPTTLQKYTAGEPKKITYGSFDIADVLSEPIDLGNGKSIPAGTPIPTGSTVGDVIKIWVGDNKDEYKGNGVVGYYLSLPKGGGAPAATKKGIYAVGIDESNNTYYTPFTKVSGALQGGLGKEDQAKFDAQFNDILQEYYRLGGTENYAPAGASKAQPATKQKKKAY